MAVFYKIQRRYFSLSEKNVRFGNAKLQNKLSVLERFVCLEKTKRDTFHFPNLYPYITGYLSLSTNPTSLCKLLIFGVGFRVGYQYRLCSANLEPSADVVHTELAICELQLR